MSKIIVKPAKVKAFLVSPDGTEIQAFRPTVVSKSSFVSVMIAQGKLMLASDSELSNEASDQAFKEIYFGESLLEKSSKDENKREELAIEEMIEQYSHTAAMKRAEESAKVAAEEAEKAAQAKADEEEAKAKAAEVAKKAAANKK